MKRTSQNYFIVALVFLLIALGLWGYFILFVHRLDASANVLETKTAEAYAKKDEIAATEHLASDIATSTETLYGAFASYANISNVVDAVEKEGKTDSVSVSVRSISTASSSDPALLTLDMNINASGSWAHLLAFAGSVERLPYALALTKASFFTNDSSKGGWSLDADITSFLSP